MGVDGGLKLTMVRENLDDLPDIKLPVGYSLVWYSPGMEADWIRIHEKAEKYLQIDYLKYEKEFGSREDDLKQRQCFIRNSQQEIVGTASAWFDSLFMGESFGRVHWVAIVPEEQGKKLSNCLLTAILLRLKDLHYHKAYLTTSTQRLGAIHLYLKFGFVPIIESEASARAWEQYLLIKKQHE